MKHTEIKVKRINFGSFILWSIYASLSIGIILGLLFAIIGLLGGDVHATFNGEEVTGVFEILFCVILFQRNI